MNAEFLQTGGSSTAHDESDLKKVTIVPVPVDFEDPLSQQPFVSIAENLTFEDTSKAVSFSALELWKDYLSNEERKRVIGFTHALIHRYTGQVGNDKPDQESQSFMRHLFVCLRVVKPMRKSFQFIQARQTSEGLDIYSFSHPPQIELPLMPITQTLNRLREGDLAALRSLLPKFMLISQPNAPLYLQRAIRFYEAGYSATTEPPLQLISWMIGIEAIISRGEKQVTPSQLGQAIGTQFGDINIKQPQWRPYLQSSAPLLVKSEIDHLLEYRNCLVHARPLPDYLRTPHADHLGQPHQLAEYLSAAAAMILQAAIIKEISEFEPGTV